MLPPCQHQLARQRVVPLHHWLELEGCEPPLPHLDLAVHHRAAPGRPHGCPASGCRTRHFLLATVILLGACGAQDDGPLRFSTLTLANGTAGQPYEAVVAVANAVNPLAAVEVSSGALPPGLTVEVLLPIDQRAWRLVGTPSAAGTFAFTIRATTFGTNHPGQQGEQAYTLLVNPWGAKSRPTVLGPGHSCASTEGSVGTRDPPRIMTPWPHRPRKCG